MRAVQKAHLDDERCHTGPKFFRHGPRQLFESSQVRVDHVQPNVGPVLRGEMGHTQRHGSVALPMGDEKHAGTESVSSRSSCESEAAKWAREAARRNPRREWWELSLEGLKDAAASVKDIGQPVIDTVKMLVPLLINASA